MIFTVTCETCPRVVGFPITRIHRTAEARDADADWHLERRHVFKTGEVDEPAEVTS